MYLTTSQEVITYIKTIEEETYSAYKKGRTDNERAYIHGQLMACYFIRQYIEHGTLHSIFAPSFKDIGED
mgnify:FL=1